MATNRTNKDIKQPNKINAIDIHTGEKSIAKRLSLEEYLSLASNILGKRKQLKYEIEELECHDNLINKYEVFALIDKIL